MSTKLNKLLNILAAALFISNFLLPTYHLRSEEMEEDYSKLECGVDGLYISLRDATKSIAVSVGKDGDFRFKRGLVIGTGELSSIKSVEIEEKTVTIELVAAYADGKYNNTFQFRDVPQNCIENIRDLLPLLKAKISKEQN